MSEPEKSRTQQIRELIELNDELENYFRNTIIPQLFVDANLILRKFTPPAMKQFRFSPDHIGKPMADMVDNIRYSTITENIQEVMHSGEVLEKEIQTTDGRWFQMNIIPYVVRKENRTNGVIITFVDITHRINVLRELEKLNASHETFIYSVTHDLMAPLANIEGLAQNLTDLSDEMLATGEVHHKEQQTVTEMLQRSVQNMRGIITDLTEVAKIEGNYQEVTEKVNFEEILKEVELTIKDKLVESRASITQDLRETELGFSRKNLRSIIYNLLSNAVKYQAPDRAPRVHLRTERKDGFVLISVKDNGRGITEEKKDVIFSQFTRVSHDVEGTGIGLYLVKKIVENAGGTITVTSQPGEGAEFVVSLPSHS